MVDGLHVALVGDLRNGRTVHSLARLLSLYDVHMTFVAPDILRLPPNCGRNSSTARAVE